MTSLEGRIQALEGYQKSLSEGNEVIFICDFDSAISGYTLCHSGAGGELVSRIPGEPLKELQDRCRALDLNHRRENPLQTKAPSIAFAENILSQEGA